MAIYKYSALDSVGQMVVSQLEADDRLLPGSHKAA